MKSHRRRYGGWLAALAGSLVAWLMMPASALASSPSVFALRALSTGPTTAELEGIVESGGQATEYYAEYGLSSSSWCHGSGSPEVTTSSTPLGGAGEFIGLARVELKGLSAESAYCTELVAKNPSGSAAGQRVTFIAGAPSVITLEERSTGTETAVIEGVVDPAGQMTEYYVAYGLASSQWCVTRGAEGSPTKKTEPSAPLGVTAPKYRAVEVEVSGLTRSDQYCAEVVATNGSGSSTAEAGQQVRFIAGAPTVHTAEAEATGPTTATIEAAIDPAGQATEYRAEYGPASSEWCKSEGSAGAPGNALPFQSLGFLDAEFHEVAIHLVGLTPGTEYCVEVVAENASGLADGAISGGGSELGAQVPFTTTALHALSVSIAGTGSGTVSGSGISCPGTCSQRYVSGTIVTLSAKAAPGSTITGWSTCSGTATCPTALTKDRTVVATFTANPPPAPVGVISLDGSAVAVKSTGGTGVKLTCAGNTTCVGKLTLTARVTTRKGRKKQTKLETIGHASFSIAPGATATVNVKLNGAGRAQLNAAHGHLAATLALARTSPGPGSTTDKTVHLTLQKAKKGRG